MGSLSLTLLFFFQAEDGIRGDLVTGVQTCALPIFDRQLHARVAHGPEVLEPRRARAHGGRHRPRDEGVLGPLVVIGELQVDPVVDRSEERRVGKECRAGWAAYQERDHGTRRTTAGW